MIHYSAMVEKRLQKIYMRFERDVMTGSYWVRFCREISEIKEFREFKEGRAVVVLSLAWGLARERLWGARA